jgi:hypothetical protein
VSSSASGAAPFRINFQSPTRMAPFVGVAFNRMASCGEGAPRAIVAQMSRPAFGANGVARNSATLNLSECGLLPCSSRLVQQWTEAAAFERGWRLEAAKLNECRINVHEFDEPRRALAFGFHLRSENNERRACRKFEQRALVPPAAFAEMVPVVAEEDNDRFVCQLQTVQSFDHLAYLRIGERVARRRDLPNERPEANVLLPAKHAKKSFVLFACFAGGSVVTPSGIPTLCDISG